MKNVYHCTNLPTTMFLVASEYEAVVASALFVPPIDPTIDPGPAEKEDPARNVHGKKVEMIGFATREGSTIESLLEAFEFTLRDARQLENAQEVVSAIGSGLLAEKT